MLDHSFLWWFLFKSQSIGIALKSKTMFYNKWWNDKGCEGYRHACLSIAYFQVHFLNHTLILSLSLSLSAFFHSLVTAIQYMTRVSLPSVLAMGRQSFFILHWHTQYRPRKSILKLRKKLLRNNCVSHPDNNDSQALNWKDGKSSEEICFLNQGPKCYPLQHTIPFWFHKI